MHNYWRFILYLEVSKHFQDEEIGTENDEELFVFSEEKYMKEKPELFDNVTCELLRQMPEVKNIYEFIKGLSESVELE